MKLWTNTIPFFNPDANTPNEMTPYLLETEKKLPCVVIYPGGAYRGRAAHEGVDIARFFNEKGFHAVVVEYRVTPNYHPAPLSDAQRAIRLVRANAEQWGVDASRIVTCGFSAGGHLCASALLLPDCYSDSYPTDEIDQFDCHPNGAILCYPVISVDETFGHVGSGKNLLGDRYEEEKKNFSMEQYVTDKTPPVFLWHTSNDSGVNVKNSLIFGECLRDHGIQFEMHIFPNGKHGLGLAKDHPDISKWAHLAADWIENNV